jgi:hypothetical protein
LIRTAYRVAELVEGFDSKVARNENLFFGLEGVMILTASLCLTVCHAGWAFQSYWADADFKLKAPRRKRGSEQESPNYSVSAKA